MRDILFKAKRLDNGAWVEGSLITYKDGTAFICCEDYIPDVLNKYEVDPATVCEWTGLIDRNGMKVFEGDQLLDPHEKRTFVVEYDALEPGFTLESNDGRYVGICRVSYSEIIGSIHDGEDVQ